MTVRDFSPYYLACRARGNQQAAIRWRRAEWSTDHMADRAEQEERRWWQYYYKETPSVPCNDCLWPTICTKVGECYLHHSERTDGQFVVNPKAERAIADGKDPLDYLESAVCDPSEARVMKSGADKYGRRNFRDSTILATTYVGAIRRHLNAFASGEDTDPDSGEQHLAHIRACCAVLLSAQDAGTYEDDRSVARTLDWRSAPDFGMVLVHQQGGDDEPRHVVTGRTGFTRNCPRAVGDACECWAAAGRPRSGLFRKTCGA